jgi:hypothetical protein
MPSKNGFGSSRTPIAKKVSYGSAMHYKNPVKQKETKLSKFSKHLKKHKGSYAAGLSVIGDAITSASSR